MKIKLFNRPKVPVGGDDPDIVSFVSGLLTIIITILNSGLVR